MENVYVYSVATGQPSDRGRLKNRTEQFMSEFFIEIYYREIHNYVRCASVRLTGSQKPVGTGGQVVALLEQYTIK